MIVGEKEFYSLKLGIRVKPNLETLTNVSLHVRSKNILRHLRSNYT